MKIPYLPILCVLAIGATALADPEGAPYLKREINTLEKKITADLSTGSLTKPDGDQLTRELNQVRNTEESEPTLTRGTRRNLRQDLGKIRKELERMEGQAKALNAAAASPTP